MVQRIAACLALIAFAACLIAGIEAENPFGTAVWRAVQAMFATLIVGLVIGWMAQRMLDENVKREREKLEKSASELEPTDR